MATILLRVVHWGKMIKISKHGWKLKLLPFSTELLFSFEIFSDHLFLMAKSKNTYMYHVTKIMTSSASFKWSSKGKMCFLDIWSMFSKTFRYNTTKTGKYVKELPLSFPKLKTELKNSLWFDFYCRFWLDRWSKNYAYFLVKIANISACT